MQGKQRIQNITSPLVKCPKGVMQYFPGGRIDVGDPADPGPGHQAEQFHWVSGCVFPRGIGQPA